MTNFDKAQEQELLRSTLDGSLRSLVLELWQETRMDWGFATDRLAKVFRRERSLASSERRFVSELLYSMIRHATRIDAALDAGGLRSIGKAPDLYRVGAALVLEHGLAPSTAKATLGELDWNAIAGIDAKLDAIHAPNERIAARHSLPAFLVDALISDYGAEEAEALAASLNHRAPMTIRANTLKGSREQLVETLQEEGMVVQEGQYAPNALHVTSRTNLFGLKAFQQGLFEAQDEGSQLIAELVAPPPKSTIVDYCAGAGGKTLSLAGALDNQGRILASDLSSKKLKELRRRAKRAGANNVQVVELANETLAAFPKPFESMIGKAVRVLVDAPCSGMGALRRNPEARWRMSKSDLERMPKLQKEIVARAFELVAPGGRLIYATCTLLRAENEDVVEGLLAKAMEQVEVISPIEVWGKERGQELVDKSGRFLLTKPHVHGCDGFFAAAIRKKPIK